MRLLTTAVLWVTSLAGARIQHPAGFTVDLPAGWSADVPGSQRILLANGDRTLFVAIEGFVEPRRSAPEWLQARFRRPDEWFPGARLGVVTGAPVALAKVDFVGPRGPARANVLCFVHQGGGTLMAIAAPAAEFEARKTELAGILRSFSFSGAGAGSGSARRYVRWTEPNERAYTIEVPEGWQVQGGLFRFSSLDVRGELNLRSPDGATTIFAGDKSLPTFTVPTQTLAMTGFREGMPYSPGYGSTFIVNRYIPGPAFAEMYAQRRFGSIQVVDRKDRPDLVQNLARIAAQYGNPLNTRYTIGEVAFTSPRGNGYVLAGTSIWGMGDSQLWKVEYLYGYLAPPAGTAAANEILARGTATYAINPQWASAQQGLTAATSQIVAKTGEEIGRIHSQSYWATQGTMDRLGRERSDANRGVVRLRDPESGEEFTAPAGANYYMRVRGQNTVLGNDTGERPPNIDVNELIRLR